MKILIDILTPKQCMLFSKLSDRLRKSGHQVVEVTRDYREVLQLLRMKGIRAKVVGRHGGATLEDKLKASTERIAQLTSFVIELKPDVAVSFSSPETSRVAFGLNIPHICINDSPHAEAVARLTIPLATRLLTTRVIRKSAWTKFGIPADRIIQYNALDAWAWLRDFEPDRHVLTQLCLDQSRPIVVFRTEESFASYLLGRSSETPVWLPMINDFLRFDSESQVVVIARYESQISLLKESLGRRVTVCESAVDGPSLLSFASVLVGAGGTMTTESALLGVPTFSCYPDKPFIVEKYLIKKGLVTRETNLEKLRTKIVATLRSVDRIREIQQQKARKLTSTYADPIQAIINAIESLA